MKKGFTLIELIVVIAIIAVLAAIVAPNAFKAIEKGKISATIGDYKSIKTSAMAYYADTGQWAAEGTDETSSPNGFISDDGKTGWDGPYLEKWPPKNAWGGSYTFRNDTEVIAGGGAARHNWDGQVGNDVARFLELDQVPNNSAERMDEQIDGGAADGTTGSVLYTAAAGQNITVYLLVSMD